MNDIIPIYFPQQRLTVRYRRPLSRRYRRVEVEVRPMSLRESVYYSRGWLDPIEASTGKPQRWFARIHPEDAVAVVDAVRSVNAWKPKELADKVENERKKDKEQDALPLTLSDLVALLGMAGHDPQAVWDYPPSQFYECCTAALRMKRRDEGLRTLSTADSVLAAITAAIGKDGDKLFEQFRKQEIASLKQNG